jgi:hypothetical protein
VSPLALVVAIPVVQLQSLRAPARSLLVGSIVVETVDGGTTAGVSGALTFKSGTTTSGPSGEFVVTTGAATAGAGG